MLTYSILNGLSLAQYGHQAWLPGDFFTYLGRAGQAAFRSGSTSGGMELLQGDLLLFLCLLLSVLLVQFKFHHLFKHLGARHRTADAVPQK